MTTKIPTLEMALMGLLLQGPRSGYDLRKTFASTAWQHYSDSPGSIYPALKRLLARGWIKTAGAGESTDPRKRQEFRPTAAGKSAVAAWLAQPLTQETVRFAYPEVMLRFAFMDGNVPRTVPLAFLEQLIQELTAHLADLREQSAELRTKAPASKGGSGSKASAVNTGILAFESGIVGVEAQLAWARKSRSRLIYANRS